MSNTANGAARRRQGGDVIAFSHFLPRKELPLPGVHEMAKASGCRSSRSSCAASSRSWDLRNSTCPARPRDRHVQTTCWAMLLAPFKRQLVHDKGRFMPSSSAALDQHGHDGALGIPPSPTSLYSWTGTTSSTRWASWIFSRRCTPRR